MTEFVVTDKRDAGRRLPLIEAEIAKLLRGINTYDGVLLLLVLEDAISNSLTKLEKALTESNTKLAELLKKEPRIRLGLLRFFSEWYYLINLMISNVCEMSVDDPPQIEGTPEMIFVVGIEEDLESILNILIQLGEIRQGDLVVSKPRKFLNLVDGFFVISVRRALGSPIETKVNQLLALRDLYYQKGLLETILKLPPGVRVRFNDKGLRQITFPEGVSPEALLRKDFFTLRHLDSMPTVPDWHSTFRDAVDKTLESIDKGVGPANRTALLKEAEEISKAYSKLPGFSQSFEATYTCKLDEFLKVATSLSMETLKFAHTILKISNKRLESLVSNIGNITRRNAKRAIDLLTFTGEGEPMHYAFFKLKGWYLTSFQRITSACAHRLELCFEEIYDNDLKGKAFENGCRDLLIRNKIRPYPGRIVVKEPMIPPEASLAIWGREKKSSDIDVLANDDNILILLECKEIKSPRIRSKETREFQKFLTELYFKACWVAENLERLESYAGEGLKEIVGLKKTKPFFVFPMLVCNEFVDVKGWEPVPFLTYSELRQVVSNRPWRSLNEREQGGKLIVKLNSQSISLAWFRCKHRIQ